MQADPALATEHTVPKKRKITHEILSERIAAIDKTPKEQNMEIDNDIKQLSSQGFPVTKIMKILKLGYVRVKQALHDPVDADSPEPTEPTTQTKQTEYYPCTESLTQENARLMQENESLKRQLTQCNQTNQELEVKLKNAITVREYKKNTMKRERQEIHENVHLEIMRLHNDGEFFHAGPDAIFLCACLIVCNLGLTGFKKTEIAELLRLGYDRVKHALNPTAATGSPEPTESADATYDHPHEESLSQDTEKLVQENERLKRQNQNLLAEQKRVTSVKEHKKIAKKREKREKHDDIIQEIKLLHFKGRMDTAFLLGCD